MDVLTIIGQAAGQYDPLAYDGKARFISIWNQINAIRQCQPSRVLEIGGGSGLTTQYLRQRGVDVVTLDIDPDLKPNLVGNASSLPFQDEVFDVVAAFQVLEHLPFEYFSEALTDIRRVTSRYTILSLPDAGKAFYFGFQLPKMRLKSGLFSLPNIFQTKTVPNEPNHYWEINLRGYPLKKVQQKIETAGFKVRRTYRVPEYAYHRFFVLEK